MPQQQQQPLAIPGAGQASLGMGDPMTDEERKWRMLLAQLQGGRQ
jgi:hypothetical protein